MHDQSASTWTSRPKVEKSGIQAAINKNWPRTRTKNWPRTKLGRCGKTGGPSVHCIYHKLPRFHAWLGSSCIPGLVLAVRQGDRQGRGRSVTCGGKPVPFFFSVFRAENRRYYFR